MVDHYFSPASADLVERKVTVPIAGRDRELVTARGVFSGDGLDLGTRILLDAVPEPPATGELLDLGCGWGPIALTLATLSPRARVWAVDVNEHALELTRRNAELLRLSNVVVAAPDAVPASIRFRTIWSNPPVRVGKAVMHAMLAEWLGRMEPEANAFLVVQKHLGADSLQSWLASELGLDAERYDSKKNFRILRAQASITPR